MSENKVPAMIVIRGDLRELDDQLIDVDSRNLKSELAVAETFRKSKDLDKHILDQKHEIELQMAQAIAVVSTTFGVVQNLFIVFGASLTDIQQATLRTMEAMIRTFITTAEAIRLSALGTLTPMAAALVVSEVASTMSAALMLMSAKEEAARIFEEANTRVIAAQRALGFALR